MCLGAYKVNKERTAGFPAWKRGLLVGVIGLAAVGGGMIVYWVLKRRQQDSYDEWDDDEAE